MQVHERGLAARLGIEVGGADRHALMQVHDVFDAGVVEQRIEQRALGGAGIAENPFHSVSQQRLEEHLSAAHFSPPVARKPHPEERPKGARLEGWATAKLVPSFETPRSARLLRMR